MYYQMQNYFGDDSLVETGKEVLMTVAPPAIAGAATGVGLCLLVGAVGDKLLGDKMPKHGTLGRVAVDTGIGVAGAVVAATVVEDPTTKVVAAAAVIGGAMAPTAAFYTMGKLAEMREANAEKAIGALDEASRMAVEAMIAADPRLTKAEALAQFKSDTADKA